MQFFASTNRATKKSAIRLMPDRRGPAVLNHPVRTFWQRHCTEVTASDLDLFLIVSPLPTPFAILQIFKIKITDCPISRSLIDILAQYVSISIVKTGENCVQKKEQIDTNDTNSQSTHSIFVFIY